MTGSKTPGLLKRILGPTADEIGLDLAARYRERHDNVQFVVDSASRKLGDGIERQGAIPLRVAAKILDEGSYCSDRVMGEYLGGVLASSRTLEGRDDRGARWVNLITSLSSYEIRLHYILYAAARALFIERTTSANWGHVDSYDLALLTTIVDWEDVELAMDFSESESPAQVFAESMFALSSEDLISRWEIRPVSGYAEKAYVTTAVSLFTFVPTPRGIQLFMWAQGLGDSWMSFADSDTTFPDIDVPVPIAHTRSDLISPE
jgi:hypothetical protein